MHGASPGDRVARGTGGDDGGPGPGSGDGVRGCGLGGAGGAQDQRHVGPVAVLLHGAARGSGSRRADARALRGGGRRPGGRRSRAAEGHRRRAGNDGRGDRPRPRGEVPAGGDGPRLARHPPDRLRRAATVARACRTDDGLRRSRQTGVHGLLRRPAPDRWICASGCEPGHLLLGAQQHRPRDRAWQPGRGRRARQVRPALLHVARRVPDRLRAGGCPRGRQRGGGRAFRRRGVRHLDRHARLPAGSTRCSTPVSRASAALRFASGRPG